MSLSRLNRATQRYRHLDSHTHLCHAFVCVRLQVQFTWGLPSAWLASKLYLILLQNNNKKRQKIKNDNNNYRHPEEMTARKLSDNKTRTKDCVFSGKAEILGNMERVVENRKCHKNSFSQNPEENRNNKERQQI